MPGHARDTQASFLAAIGAIGERLLAEIDAAVDQGPPARACYLAIEALVGFVDSRPLEAEVLINVVLEAGPRSLDARDGTLRAIARIIDAAYRGLPSTTADPDLPSDVLIGGVLRLLGSRIRGEEPLSGPFLTELFDWIACYEVPIRSRKWTAVHRPVPPTPSSLPAESPFSSPPLARRGPRSRRQASEDKRAAFLCFHELAYRRTLTLTVGAYFSRSTWPERVWTAGAAFTGFLQVNPAITRLGFVESYALGPDTAKRMDSLLNVFTLFLQDGYANSQGSRRPSRLALEAIAATIFECAYTDSREHDSAKMSELLPYGVFLALTPFLGPVAANRFIERELIRGVPS